MMDRIRSAMGAVVLVALCGLVVGAVHVATANMYPAAEERSAWVLVNAADASVGVGVGVGHNEQGRVAERWVAGF